MNQHVHCHQNPNTFKWLLPIRVFQQRSPAAAATRQTFKDKFQIQSSVSPTSPAKKRKRKYNPLSPCPPLPLPQAPPGVFIKGFRPGHALQIKKTSTYN